MVQGPYNTVQTYIWSTFKQIGLTPTLFALMGLLIIVTFALVLVLSVMGARQARREMRGAGPRPEPGSVGEEDHVLVAKADGDFDGRRLQLAGGWTSRSPSGRRGRRGGGPRWCRGRSSPAGWRRGGPARWTPRCRPGCSRPEQRSRSRQAHAPAARPARWSPCALRSRCPPPPRAAPGAGRRARCSRGRSPRRSAPAGGGTAPPAGRTARRRPGSARRCGSLMVSASSWSWVT